MKPIVCIIASVTAGVMLFAATVMAQRAGRPHTRYHTATERAEVTLKPANETLGSRQDSIDVSGTTRTITSNGIPSHPVGAFPNSGNPHTITPQNYVFTVTTKPARTGVATAAKRWLWGVAVNGVPFEAGTAEYWHRDRGGGWNYDALGGAVRLGLDANHAHVQRSGAYHYHALPTGLTRQLGWTADSHSPLIGWAADGYPVYAITGDLGNGVQRIRSSYRLKTEARPGGDEPHGARDGTFVQDWKYVAGSGDLDECNGAVTRSAEFPAGSYAYFITVGYPFVARCWKGTPDPSFQKPRRRR